MSAEHCIAHIAYDDESDCWRWLCRCTATEDGYATQREADDGLSRHVAEASR